MQFKNYEHFHKLLTDGRTDSYSDYSADPRVVKFSLGLYYQVVIISALKAVLHVVLLVIWL